MFGKTDPLETLNRDLARSRDKRDACASEVTTLTAEIAVLEARISAENDRREHERVATEIDMIKTRMKVQYHRVLRLPEWLSRKKTIEDQCNTVAA